LCRQLPSGFHDLLRSKDPAPELTDTQLAELEREIRRRLTRWWPQPDLLSSGPTDPHFVVEVDEDRRPHLRFGDGPLAVPSQAGSYAGYQGSANRTELDGRGYLGVIGQAVLAGRVLREDSDRPLPPYLQPQLGGLSTVRGFAAGSFVGDTLVAMSAELILPLTSPLKIGKFGVSAFVDRGTVYNKGERFSDQTLKDGYGGSVWFAAAFLRLNIAVAHGRGSSTRVQVGGNVTF